jgi:ankyrin repeat protein
VKLFLGHTDVNAESKDNYGRTPLSWAAKGRNEGVIKLLLGFASVDAYSRDNSGRTPRSYANERGNRGVAQLLADHVASTPTC